MPSTDPIRPSLLPLFTALLSGDYFVKDGVEGVVKVPFSALLAALGNVYQGVVAGASVPATAPVAGAYYVISSAGTSQSVTWAVGDYAIYKGTSGQWDKITAASLASTKANIDSPVFTTTTDVPTEATNARSTKTVNTLLLRRLLESGSLIYPIVKNFVTAVTGTGGATLDYASASNVIDMNTGGTANSTVVAYAGNSPLASRGGGYNTVGLSKRIVAAWRVNIQPGSMSTAIARLTVGKLVADGFGALAQKGFGFQIENFALKGICHNGTTLTTVDLATTMAGNNNYDLVVVSDGAGNITWYVNEVSSGTSALGPTGSGSPIAQIELTNGATASNREMLVRPTAYIIDN